MSPATKPHVPPTPAPEPIQPIATTKTTRLLPIALAASRSSQNGEPLTIVSILVSPIESYEIMLNEQARSGLVQALTGGVVVPA
jgi:hypothetical protein